MCKRHFLGGNRLDPSQLWEDYVMGKQTYAQLAAKHNCSKRTIQRALDKYTVSLRQVECRDVIVLMDTTYWGRGFGVMLFKDALSKVNLLKYYVKTGLMDKK